MGLLKAIKHHFDPKKNHHEPRRLAGAGSERQSLAVDGLTGRKHYRRDKNRHCCGQSATWRTDRLFYQLGANISK
jgi:hypothetical protein